MPYLPCFALCLIVLASCTGQSPAPAFDVTELSDDFDREMPVFYGMPGGITSTDTSPAYGRQGEPLLITGTVYAPDGVTPAEGVLLYYYHTDTSGRYATRPGNPRNMPTNRLGQTHGYLRGWVRTGGDGRYRIFTGMPGAYPGRREPRHVHLTLADESTGDTWYLDDVVFDHDPLLTAEKRRAAEHRGGSGVVRLVRRGKDLVGERDVYLGTNLPGSHAGGNVPFSGLPLGADVPSFTPHHAWGPDRGTRTCPVCRYGWYLGVLYFIGETAERAETERWLVMLEEESRRRSGRLKVFLVDGRGQTAPDGDRDREWADIGAALDLRHTALTWVPDFTDRESEVYRLGVEQAVGSTMLLYYRGRVVGNFVDLAPSEPQYQRIREVLDRYGGSVYFAAPPAGRRTN